MSAFVTDLDLTLIAGTRCVNYLHLGNALDLLSELLSKGCQHDRFLKREPLQWAKGSELGLVLRNYARVHKRVRLTDLQQDLRHALEWRKQFQVLRCRGFSYGLDLKMSGMRR